jgi:hypothetical protein
MTYLVVNDVRRGAMLGFLKGVQNDYQLGSELFSLSACFGMAYALRESRDICEHSLQRIRPCDFKSACDVFETRLATVWQWLLETIPVKLHRTINVIFRERTALVEHTTIVRNLHF